MERLPRLKEPPLRPALLPRETEPLRREPPPAEIPPLPLDREERLEPKTPRLLLREVDGRETEGVLDGLLVAGARLNPPEREERFERLVPILLLVDLREVEGSRLTPLLEPRELPKIPESEPRFGATARERLLDRDSEARGVTILEAEREALRLL